MVRITNIVYWICILVMRPLYMKSLTSPCILWNKPPCSVVWKNVTFPNCIRNFRHGGGHIEPIRRKPEFHTRLVIKAKDHSFVSFTEACYSFDDTVHLKLHEYKSLFNKPYPFRQKSLHWVPYIQYTWRCADKFNRRQKVFVFSLFMQFPYDTYDTCDIDTWYSQTRDVYACMHWVPSFPDVFDNLSHLCIRYRLLPNVRFAIDCHAPVLDLQPRLVVRYSMHIGSCENFFQHSILNQDSHFDFWIRDFNIQYSMHIESRFPHSKIFPTFPLNPWIRQSILNAYWIKIPTLTLDPWFHSILKSTINIRCILNQDSHFDFWIRDFIRFSNQQSIFDAYWIKIPDSTINIRCILNLNSHFDFWIREINNQYSMHIGSRFPLWLLDPWFHSVLKINNQYSMHIGSRFPLWLLDPWNQQSIFDAYWIKIPTLTFGSVISFGSQNQQSIFDAYWIKIPDSTINIECILDQDSHFDFWIRDFDNQYWMHIGSRFPLWLLDPWFHSILKSTINIRCILNLNSWFDNQYWMHIGSRFVMWN